MSAKNLFMAAILLMLLLSSSAISQEKLLIIAHPQFIDELQPLKQFKDASARPTILLSLTDVYTSFTGADEPEQIKRCIAHYENTDNIQFVLLVGDCDKFPVRYCRAYNTEWGVKWYPSDLYYMDLYNDQGQFDDWDGDGDDIYFGEMDFAGGTDINNVNLDSINMYPDVAVARVPASNDAEVSTYVNKVVSYEMNVPGNWFNNALLVVGDWGGDAIMDGLVAYLSGFTPYKRYMSQPPWDANTDDQRADEINRFLNSQGAGIANYHGHGNTDEWVHWYDQNKMGSLTNEDMLPVLFATACYTGRFHFLLDYYEDVQGNLWTGGGGARPKPMPVQPATCDRESLAEHFLVKRNAGGIAYIGCTSKVEAGAWLSTTKGLCPYFYKHYDQGTRTLGQLWKDTMSDFVADVEKVGMGDYYSFIHIHKMMLFGDPSLQIGGAFNTTLCSNVYDGNGGPLQSGSRYRVNCNVTVPTGQKLTANPGVSVVFESGKKITAMDANPGNGLIVNGTTSQPMHFLSETINPQAQGVCGVKVTGQMRLRNGGEIKLY